MNRLPAHRQVIHGRTFAQSWSAASFDPIAHYRAPGAWLPALSVLLAVACGIGAGLALLSWLTPCEAGALCAAPIATRSRRGWGIWQRVKRLALAPRVWVLRARMQALLEEAREHELMGQVSPRLAKTARAEAEAVLRELRALELDARQN